MTGEQIEHLATREQLADLRAEFHKELGSFKYDLTWRMITILGIQTTVLLGAIYFMLEHWK